jgi:hypothetical protein
MLTSEEKKLIFLLVHGIGPQSKVLHQKFLDSVKAAVQKHLGAENEGLLKRLVMLRADWSCIFKSQSDEWLATLFPDCSNRSIRAERIRSLYCFAWMTLIVAGGVGFAVAIYFCGPLTHQMKDILPLFPRAMIDVAAWSLLMVPFLWLVWRFYIGFRLPWGDAWNLSRGFEADNLSDVILYQSEKPRQKIVQTVLDELKPYLDNGPAETRQGGLLPIVLAGHSLGTLVVYDMLLGAVAEAGAGGSVRRELKVLERNTERSQSQNDRLRFLTDVLNLLTRLRVVGMATFGSPIALFLFRKPELLKRRDLWREACPPEFEETGISGKFRWEWTNFWHTADFVAHRLEPLFNRDFPLNSVKDSPTRLFVEDVRVRRPVRDPISAHSEYWEDPAVIERIAAQLAECLKAL